MPISIGIPDLRKQYDIINKYLDRAIMTADENCHLDGLNSLICAFIDKAERGEVSIFVLLNNEEEE